MRGFGAKLSKGARGWLRGGGRLLRRRDAQFNVGANRIVRLGNVGPRRSSLKCIEELPMVLVHGGAMSAWSGQKKFTRDEKEVVHSPCPNRLAAKGWGHKV
jgi:hypothetical protein